MAKCEKILICGFSGSGKSAFLRHIEASASDSDWKFSDLDEIILKNHHYSELSELIHFHGWEKFRLWERQALDSWLKEEEKGVLSLGGGALTQLVFDSYGPIRKIKFCYLSSSFEDCWKRLHLPGVEPRPLLKAGKEELGRIYQERKKSFSQISWKIENPDGCDLKTLARLFWEEVKLYSHNT
jgi:shikimate kinase